MEVAWNLLANLNSSEVDNQSFKLDVFSVNFSKKFDSQGSRPKLQQKFEIFENSFDEINEKENDNVG